MTQRGTEQTSYTAQTVYIRLLTPACYPVNYLQVSTS